MMRGAALLCALLSVLALGTAGVAEANRALLSEHVVHADGESSQIPEKQIEGACGVAISSGAIYVSDYYHHAVDVFDSATQILVQPQPNSVERELEGPCGLAFDASGNLYVNYWHQRVVKSTPPYSFGAVQTFDSDESTGVAVDRPSGNVYVDDRTYVAVYQPSGAPLLDAGQPLRIGIDSQGASSIGDGFGVAVFAGKVYVPDAADDTVKVYEPAVDPAEPAMVIDGSDTPQGGFNSLVDAAVAVDPTNGHLLVLDNLQPGFEHPQAAIEEFDASGDFLGQLSRTVVDGEPSGLAFSGSGELYATSGNDEEANVFLFGPYAAAAPAGAAPLAAGPPASASVPERAEASPHPLARRPARGPSASSSEVVQRGSLRVSFDGSLTPHVLPRHGTAPVEVAFAAKIASTNGGPPPRLRQIRIAINRYGRFTPQGLPLCHVRDIQPATTANGLAACRGSLVGEGHFSAKVMLAQQAPFPAEGKVLAFNGILHGKPAILAHVYGTDPVPTSYTLPFVIGNAEGTFGTVLRASLPATTGSSGYVTGLSLTLGRRFSSHGHRRSYLNASCPAPAGFPGAVFPFAQASFGFAGRGSISSTLTRSCKARG
jgi:DNA-binding beta-propeller fold protein YncE